MWPHLDQFDKIIEKALHSASANSQDKVVDRGRLDFQDSRVGDSGMSDESKQRFDLCRPEAYAWTGPVGYIDMSLDN
ncbi:hypothetical protein E4U09_004809, partial [Claviceps aff. purpurea]